MKHPLLKAEKRTVLGKKVKKLRREGILPANVYGKNIPSVALQVKMEEFQKIHKTVGETGLIDLEFDGKTKPVLVKSLQMNFDTHTPLHADFYQVNLKEKIKSMVPLVLVGDPQAVTDKVGMLQQNISDVEVEALPEKLPENIEVSVEHLAAIGEGVTVADLKAPADVTILTDETQVIAKIAELVVAEPEPEEEAEGEEDTAENTEGETASEESGEDATESTEETTENNG